MDARKAWLALKTPVTLVLLLVFVAVMGSWGYAEATKPIPKRPPDPCVVTQVGPDYTAKNAWIRIFNGTETSRLASNTKLVFGNAGFHVVKIGNTETPVDKTFIVGVDAHSPEVVLVRSYFPAETPFTADPTKVDHTVDITLGKDYKSSMINPKPTLSVPLPDGKACIPTFKDVADG